VCAVGRRNLTMVRIEPWKKNGSGGWEIDLRLTLPSGQKYRERLKSPVSGKENARRWGTAREARVLELAREGLDVTRIRQTLKGLQEVRQTVERVELTVAELIEMWIAQREARGVAAVQDERTRLRLHVIPVLGAIPARELRPRHVRDFIVSLRQKKSGRTREPLAPRTVRHVYAALRQVLHDAVVDEFLDSNPCVLKRGDLPRKTDKDPRWRSGAVFSREEIEVLITDKRIPEDRRVLYALEFLTGMRSGEAAALRWSSWDETAAPLGKLGVAVSYDSRAKAEKATKTERPREVPVHPALARVLVSWRDAGWSRFTGRRPADDDLIVPAARGGSRNVSYSLKAFHFDLATLGLRERRHYDSRRTFISLGQADGARKEVLKWITHGAAGDIVDLYTTLPWATLCEAVVCIRVGTRDAQVIPFPTQGRGDVGETPEASEEAEKKEALTLGR
jgi:integrase